MANEATKCKVGDWLEVIDAQDSAAFDYGQDTISRVNLHGLICGVFGDVFALTTMKDHILRNCVCYRS